jgi:hypothetical protein
MCNKLDIWFSCYWTCDIVGSWSGYSDPDTDIIKPTIKKTGDPDFYTLLFGGYPVYKCAILYLPRTQNFLCWGLLSFSHSLTYHIKYVITHYIQCSSLQNHMYPYVQSASTSHWESSQFAGGMFHISYVYGLLTLVNTLKGCILFSNHMHNKNCCMKLLRDLVNMLAVQFLTFLGHFYSPFLRFF